MEYSVFWGFCSGIYLLIISRRNGTKEITNFAEVYKNWELRSERG